MKMRQLAIVSICVMVTLFIGCAGQRSKSDIVESNIKKRIISDYYIQASQLHSVTVLQTGTKNEYSGSFEFIIAGIVSNPAYYLASTDDNGNVISFNKTDKQILPLMVFSDQYFRGEAGGYMFLSNDYGKYGDFTYLEAAPFDIIRTTDGKYTISNSTDEFLNLYAEGIGVGRGSLYNQKGERLFMNGTTKYDEENCTLQGIGTGQRNTQMIIDAIGEEYYFEGEKFDYAAKICADLEYNGFDDWYLPSKEEIGKLLNWVGDNQNYGLGAGGYVTSSEAQTEPYFIVMESTLQDKIDENILRIRPIRKSHAALTEENIRKF